MISKFRIHPESPRSFYFDVEIHPTLAAMRKTVRRQLGSSRLRTTLAVTQLHRVPARPKYLGTIRLSAGHLDLDNIVHECAHAAFGWARAVGFNPFPEPDEAPHSAEERYCYGLDQMVHQIEKHIAK